MIGRGLLRHVFHGTAEAARVILAFDSPEGAALALAIVGAPFAVAEGEPRAIVASFTRETLQAFKDAHAARIAIDPCGFRHCHPRAKTTIAPCKATAIDSLTHSIDVGPRFTFDAGALQPRPAPRKRAPRNARPVTHTACTVERRALVRHETLSLATGEISPSGKPPAWEVKACSVPLFTDAERERGVCRSCGEGWTHPENAPTPAGVATIARAFGRCVACGASGFRYSPHHEPRGYECMTCGVVKPERDAVSPDQAERARNAAATAAGKRGVRLPPKGTAARKDLALASDRDEAARAAREVRS